MSGFVVQGVIQTTVIVRERGGNSYFFLFNKTISSPSPKVFTGHQDHCNVCYLLQSGLGHCKILNLCNTCSATHIIYCKLGSPTNNC